MPALDDFRCDRCGFELPHGEGGNFYVLDAAGQKIPCPLFAESGRAIREISKEIPDFREQLMRSRTRYYRQRHRIRVWWARLRGEPPPFDPEELYRARTGFDYDSVCCDCLAQFCFDADREPRVCPSCGSRSVKTLIELLDKSCPECVLGTIRRIDTGIWA